MNEDTCICCGTVIPEGRQICWICERGDNMMIDYDSTFDKIQELYKNSSGEAHKAYSKCLDVIADMPTIDAEPVKYGKWTYDNSYALHCSYCGREAYYSEYGAEKFPFCPYCGAEMYEN